MKKKRGVHVTLCLSVPDRLGRIGGFMLCHLQGSQRTEKKSQWAADVEEEIEQTKRGAPVMAAVVTVTKISLE